MSIQHTQCPEGKGGNNVMVSDINGLCDVAVYDVSGSYDIVVCVMLQFLTSETEFLAIWVCLRSKTASAHVMSQFVTSAGFLISRFILCHAP